MRRFAALYDEIDATTSTNTKVEAMRLYFASVPAEDGAWGVYFLTGRKLRRLLSYVELKRWAQEESGLPGWLFDETRAAVGDLAETIALVLDTRYGGGGAERNPATDVRSTPERQPTGDLGLAAWVEAELLPLRTMEAAERRAVVVRWWREFDRAGVLVVNKLLTGALRVGVSKTLVIRALAEHFGVERDAVARRIQGEFKPTPGFFASIGEADDGLVVRPEPFYLASPVDGDARALREKLGPREDWLAEYKWDGIRAQAVRQGPHTLLWSRGEEPVSDAFPELVSALSRLPDGVILDGEILAYDGSAPLPFATLQKRLGRKSVSLRNMAQHPVVFMAYDLLADEKGARTGDAIEVRREAMERLIAELGAGGAGSAGGTGSVGGRVRVSALVGGGTWEELEAERSRSRVGRVEGLMLKRRGSVYRAGRVRGDWWKWKIEPYTLDLVMTYAEPGSGRRANLLTDYTFGVWVDRPGGELVTLTKAYSGLDASEIARVDAWARANTLEKFGPVRRVKPELVFELAFEGLQWSQRHRAGVALRFPRMARWRTDKTIMDTDTLATVRAMLEPATPDDEQMLPGVEWGGRG